MQSQDPQTTSLTSPASAHTSAHTSAPAAKSTRRMLSRRCAQLLEINQELFDLGYVEAAYHALEAAIHCAMDLQDLTALRRTSERAAEQHRQMELRWRPYLGGNTSNATAPPLFAAEATRWTSMERLFAAAERQATSKATAMDRERSRL